MILLIQAKKILYTRIRSTERSVICGNILISIMKVTENAGVTPSPNASVNDEEERLNDPGSFQGNLEEQQQARENAFLEMDQEVSSLVVRDLWSRSRLPASELEMVWDLVDNTGVGRGLSYCLGEREKLARD
ncbi:hypothetical protein KC331_g4878 [Hortaea werneckii]|nr:hypothetical protein KC331_g4878 [Hortaea werneckii]KAI7719764.1 hypothetical protein KC353_g2720 [Hortaea werneckii]